MVYCNKYSIRLSIFDSYFWVNLQISWTKRWLICYYFVLLYWVTQNDFWWGSWPGWLWCWYNSRIYQFIKYCSHEEANFSLNTSQERDLSVLYINIVSLSSNMTTFLHLLTKFDKKIIVCYIIRPIRLPCGANYLPFGWWYRRHLV